MWEIAAAFVASLVIGYIGWRLKDGVEANKEIKEIEEKLINARRSHEIANKVDSMSASDVDKQLQGIYRD